MEPATQLALITGIFAVIMFVLQMWKERRIDERQRLAEQKADERAHQLVTKVDEVKEVAVVASEHAQTVARNTSTQTVEAIATQTVELKEAIKQNGNGGSKETP